MQRFPTLSVQTMLQTMKPRPGTTRRPGHWPQSPVCVLLTGQPEKKHRSRSLVHVALEAEARGHWTATKTRKFS